MEPNVYGRMWYTKQSYKQQTSYDLYKIEWSRYRPSVAQRVSRGIALLFHDRGTRRGWVVISTPRPHFTPGKTRYPLYRRLGGPQGRSGRAENLVPPGFDPGPALPTELPGVPYDIYLLITFCVENILLYWSVYCVVFDLLLKGN